MEQFQTLSEVKRMHDDNFKDLSTKNWELSMKLQRLQDSTRTSREQYDDLSTICFEYVVSVVKVIFLVPRFIKETGTSLNLKK